ncbi:MAG TPA: CBS domain-containing protein [Polyangiaceae bacterium]|nr:CBS domain-containing protein [Polyangiaceae bacterium]
MTNQPRVAADIMSRDLVTLHETQNLRFLPEVMKLFRFRHMPVVDDDRLVGLVTERDVLRVSASSLLPAAHEQTDLLARTFVVRDMMTRDVVSVHPDTPLAEVARLMRREKLGCLPVVEGENTLVGIITEADFVALSMRYLNGELH